MFLFLIKPSYTLTSSDIVNLCTNVQITETVDLLEENFKHNFHMVRTIINESTSLVKTVSDQNYFQFNGNFYIYLKN